MTETAGRTAAEHESARPETAGPRTGAPEGVAHDAPERFVGKAVRRKEDPRFLTGRGRFLEDRNLAGQVYAHFVRASVAHARITGIDTAEARSVPGVVAVFTADDLEGVRPIPLIRQPPDPGVPLPELRTLASGTVRWVGEPVAVVLAESPEAAADGAEAVQVSYDPLPAVCLVEDAIADDAPTLHEGFDDNCCFRTSYTGGDAEGAFATATHRVRRRMVNHRVAPFVMEPRGMIAAYDRYEQAMDVWITTQRPHHTRWFIGQVLDMPEHLIRVDAGDVGGAFGAKEPMYPDEAAVAFAARALGRPVKWVEERAESFLATTHGRDHVADLEVAFDGDGVISAMRGRILGNMGAYLYPNSSGTIIGRTGPLLPQSYAFDSIDVEIVGVFTNTTPTGPYRGAGRPEATYYTERLIDEVAAELGLDPAEVRRRNYIPAGEFPWQTPTGLEYDSGDYAAALQTALDEIDYDGVRALQRNGTDDGRLIGVGIASYVEIGGVTPSSVAAMEGSPGLWESAAVTVHPSGKVNISMGTCGHGQGHETTFAQIAADTLRIPYDDITIAYGNTETSPFGFGTFGSRSAAVGGTAVLRACEKVVTKARRWAAELLEADERDIEQVDGAYQVSGVPTSRIRFADLASKTLMLMKPLADGEEPGLDAIAYFDPPNYTFSSGTHACVVEVDPLTGRVEVSDFVAVDDCGTVINPLVADGQIHGGVAQGISQALYERIVYDADGQPMTSSLMDYTVPTAAQTPELRTARAVSASPVNPIGVKGIGESGAIGSTPAVANAVLDALRPAGVRDLDMPFTPERVWAALQKG
ncbi:xanthine dehydrogenase family protein molybdopterin-binding subunit [Actinobacteria bacterium YIM 96077]|uniref:Xanthine dehydrogenase family protein molybdopterin-binding subunit n=1 Tax=Phytoactinopolyspora halophila TaxID=1981511 RepID=A0A329QST8_9ACTN|nr:xanthine dehydrogenase family protein molybdopterin-binding subunit [Phytoactinopolyspora halophila]AYY15003.1 xanthine dehydrogenase family protein molybdopterin-binding subunit [Actinobacteria bacterium YIM 96077]RAW15460.1 xanthine dehydrogenase family protein molybdopterin-binding subunit [Phytoactinopolyspora halophila]